MLKERDKRLLFYSWSYGILAVALIYACCGYGVMAAYYTLGQHVNGNSPSTQNVSNGQTVVTNLYNPGLPASQVASYVGYFCNIPSGHIPNPMTGVCESPHSNPNFPSPYNTMTESSVTISEGVHPINTTFIYYVHAVAYGDNWNNVTILSSWYWKNPVTAPVINDFTSDASCYSPGEAIVLESNVTGSPDSWLWEIYNSDDVSVYTSTDSVETIVDETFEPGLYQVQLYVENEGGNDFLSKDNWLNITSAGGCLALNNWSPFPTITTVTPTQGIFETMTIPPHIVTNLTGINEEINQSIFGNMSQGYRDYFDYIGDQANTTFTGAFRTLLSPVTQIVNGIAAGISLFSSAFTALQGYTTVPLAITAIVINYMPWQIVTLITAGIAIDAILILILGR